MRSKEHFYAGSDVTRGNLTRMPIAWDRFLWVCPIVLVIATAALLWVFDFTFWTALGVAFLLACPASVAWAMLAERLVGPRRNAR